MQFHRVATNVQKHRNEISSMDIHVYNNQFFRERERERQNLLNALSPTQQDNILTVSTQKKSIYFLGFLFLVFLFCLTYNSSYRLSRRVSVLTTSTKPITSECLPQTSIMSLKGMHTSVTSYPVRHCHVGGMVPWRLGSRPLHAHFSTISSPALKHTTVSDDTESPTER